MLGDSNIIFFINVLQESIYTVWCVAFGWALGNQPSIILADESRTDLDSRNSDIIAAFNLEAKQSVRTDNSDGVP